MCDIYNILENNLEIDQNLNAVIYMVNQLEQSFSEESHMAEKYLMASVCLALTGIQKKMNQSVIELDQYIVDTAEKNGAE